MVTMDPESLKDAAIAFLEHIIDGDIEAAYERYVDMDGKHHDPFTPAGFPALLKSMMENRYQPPNRELRVVNALAEGDMAAVQTHMRMDGSEFNATYFFRFREGRIVELWDCGQALPAESPNTDGVF